MNDEVQAMEDGVIEVQSDVESELNEAIDYREKYEGLKSKIGSLANERAELLRVNNELLQSQLSSSQDDDYYVDPAEKTAKAALNEVQQLKIEGQMRDLSRDFPDYQNEVKSEAFQEWVSSSAYRQRRFAAADAMDFDAARELLSEWTEKKGAAMQVQGEREAGRRQALNSASMEKGSAGAVGKKVWDRNWLVEQQINNPSWYKANYAEIMAAYREGRVKKR